jgi:hypothetical protein
LSDSLKDFKTSSLKDFKPESLKVPERPSGLSTKEVPAFTGRDFLAKASITG